MKKPRGDAKLKILPDALQEELYQLLRRTTQEKAAAWLLANHAITTSAGALTGFYSWYPRSCWLKQAASFSETLESTLTKLPQMKVTAEQAKEVAQVSFEIQAAQNRDPELFAMLSKGGRENAKLQLEREKFEESKKEGWQKGLEALHAEIKGNAQAMEIFNALTAVLMKARS